MYSNNNVEISVLKQDLPQDIVDRFFDVLLDLVEIEDLEGWIYNEARLEKYLHQDDYLDLISMDFQKGISDNYDAEKIRHRFGYIVAKYIQNAEYTKAGDRVTQYKIKYLIPEYLDGSKFTIEDITKYEENYLKYLLYGFLDRQGDLIKISDEFYNLYCKGYKFLGFLGYPYGCEISTYVCELEDKTYHYFFPKSHTREDIARDIQIKIEKNYSAVDREIKQVLAWLESKQIEITIDPTKAFVSDAFKRRYFDRDYCIGYHYHLGYIDRRNNIPSGDRS